MTQPDIDTLRAENERLRAALAGLRDAAKDIESYAFHDGGVDNGRCGEAWGDCKCGYCDASDRFDAAIANADAVLGESK